MRLLILLIISTLFFNPIAYAEDNDGWEEVPLSVPQPTPSNLTNNVTFNNTGGEGLCASQLVVTQKDLAHEKLLKVGAMKELIREQDDSKRLLGIPAGVWFLIGGIAGASAVYFGVKH